MKTAYLTSPLFLEHDTGNGHPERAERLVAINNLLNQNGLWDELVHLSFEPAGEADLELCHTPQHIARVKSIAQKGGGALDGDTKISPRSFEAAALAAGAAMRAVDAVWSGEVDNAFVAERPCGHHAESGRRPNSLWGFCLFNHAAIAARHAQRKWGAERVAILDFDVHHGNGTQEIFYDDSSVFFASIHESPLFPHQGAFEERGKGEGVGTTLNFPLPAESDGELYRLAWGQVGLALAKFQPQLIILSAGYDAHSGDPLAHMELHPEDFASMVSEAKSWASTLCEGRLVAVLEGGYHLNALANSVAATLNVLKSD
jgi:acetoin utilization deacetylase AcuC-like enzyme